ncbi:MAG: FmdB family zinc ribbon protein [Ottowia sp.]
MPIYAYKCSACGFAKDVLQKMSDAPLTECPACHQATFAKQVTAAGFQLKGSGWYVTDFRNGGQGKSASSSASSSDGAGAGEKSAASAAPAADAAAAPAPAKSSAAA